MNISVRRPIGALAIAAVLLLGQGGLAHAASPAPSAAAPSGPTGAEMLSVQPSLINVAGKPGTTTTTELTLRAAATLAVSIKVQGLGQAKDGNFTALAPADDTRSSSARPWMTFSPDSLLMKAGDLTKVAVKIAIPQDAGEGSRYAILTITGMPVTPSGSANVGIGVELGVSTIVQLAGTAQTRTGEIDGINLDKSLPGKPLPVTVSFKNTGNTHFGAIPDELEASATLQDASGTELATASASGNQLSVLPGYDRELPLSMTPSKALVDGATYHVEVGVGLKDGTVLDRKAIDFTWSGGAVFSPTAAPIQQPPVSSVPASGPDSMMLALAGLLGAALLAALAVVAVRRRRRGRPDAGAVAE